MGDVLDMEPPWRRDQNRRAAGDNDPDVNPAQQRDWNRRGNGSQERRQEPE